MDEEAMTGQDDSGGNTVGIDADVATTGPAARSLDETLEEIVNESNDGFLVTDHAGTVIWASRTAGRLFGIPSDRLVGQWLGSPREVPRPESDVEIIASDGGYGSGQMSVRPVEWRGSAANLVVIRDTSISTSVTRQLAYAHDHDALTGLPGRKALGDRLRQARDRALRYGGGYCVIMVIPDQIATVSTSLGYDESEEFIREVARRLADCMAAMDALARIDHQTFAFVSEDVPNLEQAKAIARRIAGAFDQPIQISGRTLLTSVSMGVAHSDGSRGSDEDLLRDARAAMVRGHSPSRNSIGAFTDDSATALKRQFEFGEALRSAVSRNELFVCYQPIVTADLGQVHATEALVRWDRGRLGTVMPGRFIAVAESMGICAEIDSWVLRSACRQAARWNDRRPQSQPLDMHVNIAAGDLLEPGFVVAAAQILQETSVDPARICLELTETTLADPRAIAELAELRRLGCRFAIDDFGTGFSSFAYLGTLTPDVLKIDRSFVSGLGTNHKDRLIVNSIIGLARGLHLLCIAEGVETTTQADSLRELGCELFQGYLIAKPMSARDLSTMLTDRWGASGAVAFEEP